MGVVSFVEPFLGVLGRKTDFRFENMACLGRCFNAGGGAEGGDNSNQDQHQRALPPKRVLIQSHDRASRSSARADRSWET